jgi:hypothetical protein
LVVDVEHYPFFAYFGYKLDKTLNSFPSLVPFVACFGSSFCWGPALN